MPFARPTLTQLTQRIVADFTAAIPGADSRLRRSVLNVLARVVAAGFHALYGYLDYIARQALPDTAEAEVLQRWASDFGVARQAATPATGMVTATGTSGSSIPNNTKLQRADGVEYLTQGEVSVIGGVAHMAVVAKVAGASGLADEGVGVTFISPVGGVASAALVAEGGLTGGADEEDDDALRIRLLERLRDPPAGGKASDYVKWAKAAGIGVTRVWVYPLDNGLGTVGVTFVLDDREDIIPGAGDVDAVEAAIEAERPVTAAVTVFAPTPDALDFDITLTPDTLAVRAAVEAELRDLLSRDAEPGGTLPISRIREAVSIAAGETDNVVNSPSANVVSSAGHMAVMGDISW